MSLLSFLQIPYGLNCFRNLLLICWLFILASFPVFLSSTFAFLYFFFCCVPSNCLILGPSPIRGCMSCLRLNKNILHKVLLAGTQLVDAWLRAHWTRHCTSIIKSSSNWAGDTQGSTGLKLGALAPLHIQDTLHITKQKWRSIRLVIHWKFLLWMVITLKDYHPQEELHA